jgi:tetratricopeptide (TPR) repeat protein
MKSKAFITIILINVALIFSNAGCARQKAESREVEKTSFKTPADASIIEAKKLVEQMPDLAKSHNKLAAAYLQKVREIGDYDINRQAEKSIRKAMEIEPDNFDAQILQTQIYLSEHKFAEALDVTKNLAVTNPNNVSVYVAMTDAQTELGQYEEAVATAQKLVDMRPNATSYTRVAHLRSLYGDISGAIEARKLAVKIADPGDKEGSAWFHSELGRELFAAGKFAEAEREFEAALSIFPDYHWALAGKGQILASRGELETAAQVYQKLYEQVPQTGRAIFLGDIYKKLGREQEAQEIYNKIVERERETKTDIHRIALFWADHDTNLDEALDIARKDREVNSDLLASDILAWCLYKKGEFAEAKKYIAEAMRLKTKNAQFFYHAGMIENSLGNRSEAKKLLQTALDTNPSFDLFQADVARKTLSELN